MSIFADIRDQFIYLPIVSTTSKCEGGTYIVTGSNTGLGLECAKHLVQLSAKTVILGVRSLSKGDAAKARIEAETGRKGVVEVWHLDLSSYATVVEFAEKIKKLDRLDAIVENASVGLTERIPAEGLESSLTVNVVSTFLLAVLVLPKLEESAKKFGIETNLAVIGSAVYSYGKGVLEKIDGDILDGLDASSMANRYPVTKLLQLYAFRQLASLRPVSETGVTIDYVNPGLCKTELNRNSPWGQWLFVEIMKLLIGRTAEAGSRTLLHGATAGKESHGKFFSACKIKESGFLPWVTDDAGSEMQRRVWDSLVKKLNAIQPGCI
ncbi:NAD(P)-binding protein [Rhizodiscina lignyota]|uniref:NAD(P)-binding protein n=1 Tax=Rhizodiscina lignyota TaxID=1504668 RepID=A0A9P4IE38_9PEZI|nr:NAD(P)-binding protein [Rhizodiscina lignyota]